MSTSPLIDAAAAWARLQRGGAVAVDCRFDLADTGRGERDYAQAHVPGAVYAHLDRDLSDHAVHGRGRHPLPSAAAFIATLARWGITPATTVLAYDDANGAHAARLWWMLRLLGHHDTHVIDGGWQSWLAHNLPTSSETALRAPDIESHVCEDVPPAQSATPRSSRFPEGGPPAQGARGIDAGTFPTFSTFDTPAIATTAEVDSMRRDPTALLLDARAAPRFRGEHEPIDPVAGHIPGARNRPFADNLAPDQRFKPAAQLRAELEPLLAGRDPRRVVLMCGSGVTACHNLLALEHAGLPGARVYAGSWSEWIADPSRPVAKGE